MLLPWISLPAITALLLLWFDSHGAEVLSGSDCMMGCLLGFDKKLHNLFFINHLGMPSGLLFWMRISQSMFAQCLGMLITLILILRQLSETPPTGVMCLLAAHE